jgi:hypothetical protein
VGVKRMLDRALSGMSRSFSAAYAANGRVDRESAILMLGHMRRRHGI